ncbi:S-adenosyl-L-methionine-dependent methyltransferase [Mycena vulgaris]|nr:S-adenosyl-L-methionine-dependent methyltransferase [Mycena vulgaris]
MDYACGTGIVSRRLAPHCKTLLGVDISQGMVDQFNKGVESDGSPYLLVWGVSLVSTEMRTGIPSDKMHAVRAELKGEEPELEGATFDVVLCSLAYHHITDIAAVTRVLAFFLKPGGTLLVVDYPKMDTSTIPAEFVHIVAHQGISEAVIKDVYTGAGLGDFRCVFFKGPKAEQTDTPRMHPEDMFLALGVKI